MKTKLKFKNYLNVFRFGKWTGIACMILLAASCANDPIGQQPTDSTPPKPLVDAFVEELPGGALVTYVTPDDDTDISYIRGEYEFAGQQYVVRSSVYTDHFTVEGLTGTNPITINLYVVDHSENSSTPISRSFTPKTAAFATIGNTVKISPAIGGIVVRWENPDMRSDIGVVLLVWDTVNNKLKEHAVSFALECAAYYPFPEEENTFAAYVMDKWGNYSDTTSIVTTPVREEWLSRRRMKAHYMGNDIRMVTNYNPADAYYSEMVVLFDSIAKCLGASNAQISGNCFITSGAESMPICFTMDLGVVADVSRFWFGPRTHTNTGRYWAFQVGSPYNWDLWGTEEDFELIYPDPDDPYWTQDLWKQDPRWKYMGNYTHRRPSNIFGTPENPGGTVGDASWVADRAAAEAHPDVNYVTNHTINVLGVGPVRYIRWQVNKTWGLINEVDLAELWYWGGIISIPKE